MEKSLFDKDGNVVAYLTDDYHGTIYLWDGHPVAYLYEDQHIYGINGRHLGWFINEIIFDRDGRRIGFTTVTCPVSVAREHIKEEKYPMDELRPRWKAPPLPKLEFSSADRDLAEFLREGGVPGLGEKETPEEAREDE